MNNKIYILFFVVAFTTLYGQVGINTNAPKATMDINAKRANVDGTGAISDNTKTIGLLAPRLTRAELTANTATYNADQAGALIYVTDISGGDVLAPRTNVTAVGYYYYDADTNLWKAVGSGASSLIGDNVTTKVVGNKIKGIFFYMPSIKIDLTVSSPTPIELYTKYVEQFSLANPATTKKNPGAPATIPYAPSNALDYYVTYYDPAVINIISLTDSGQLTYEVVGPATAGTFVNVVFVQK